MSSVKNDNTDILVLDEIGYYEPNGMVWHELFLDAETTENYLACRNNNCTHEINLAQHSDSWANNCHYYKQHLQHFTSHC